MAERPVLTLEPRAEHGSSVARKLRRAGRVPAVLYGHGEPMLVSLDTHEFQTSVAPSHFGSEIVRLQLDGQSAGEALVKSVQTNPVGHRVLAVDLLRVSGEDRLHVSVSVVLVGDAPGVHAGGVLEQMLHSVNLRCRAQDVPQQIVYDISNMQVGESIHFSHLSLPENCEVLDALEETIAVILSPTVPAGEEPVTVEEGVSGPQLAGGKEKDDFPPER
ncbi:MAG TPA: 50S ribosomal protein L25 [Armatimonadota bacterium]|jgi:large subunit ribosomal protein L25